MRKAQVILSTVLVLIILVGTIAPLAPVRGQTPPPEILGPGWHLGEADPVSPAEARRVLASRPRPTSRAPAGIPASETEATPEIQALARALENDPKLIFDYVHNHIEYVPTFGSMNGATAILLAGRGNDWDQTSLFIALMRAAGYTADYVVADATYSSERLANWAGVPESSVLTVFARGGVPVGFGQGGILLTRVWAQAEIGSHTYVFDPAMKEYTATVGIDLDAATGYDRATFMADAQEGATVGSDSVQNMNEANVRADLTTYSMNLVNYIQTNMPDAALAEVIGGREIVQAEMSSYSVLPPYVLDVTNEQVYTAVPATYRHTLRLQHEGINYTFYTFQIAGKRVSIFYDAADNYKPLLRVDGDLIAAGNATSPGGWYDLTLSVNHPYAADGGTYGDQTDTSQLISGYDYVIVHDFGTASQDLIAQRNRLLDQYLQDGLAEDSEAVRGEGLWLMGLNYSYEAYLFARLLGQVGGGVFVQHHLVGLMAQEEGYFIDLPLFLPSFTSSGGASTITAYRAYAMMAGALEHGMLEQMQGSDREALSSIKVLQLNNEAGNRTFLADADNWNAIRPLLQNYSPDTLTFIEDEINAGYTFVLPEDGSINLNQWHGSGYIGYKGTSMGMWIGGGYAGGMSSGMWGVLIQEILDILEELGLLPDQKEESKTLESEDPVDMVTGAFHYTSLDLVAGPDGLLDVAFARSYNSGGNYSLGPLGYGWSHNLLVSLVPSSDYAPGLGQRQPTDAASLIVYAQVALDVLEQEENTQGWMATDLATKWAMDQLIDNAFSVHLSTTSLEYVRLADGSYNLPLGLDQALIQQGDYTYVQGSGNTCMIFDADGRGRVWLDANGNTLTYTYDGEGKLLSVGAPTLGQTLTLVYSGTLLTSVSDQAGRTVAFEYTDDELTTFRDAEGHATHYSYDAAHRLVSVTRPRGNTVVTNVYDDLGRVQTQTDARGNTTTFYFGGFRNVEAYPDGSRVVSYIDAKGRTIAREDALGQRAYLTYDGQYHLRTITDRLGGVTAYAYDPTTGQVAAVTNAEGDTTSYTYTPQSHTFTNPLNDEDVTLTAYYMTRVDYADGSYGTLSYDARGNLASRTDAAGQTWTYQANARGQVTRITHPAGGQIEYTYNANGTLASSTDSDTGVITYGYDAYLRQNRITHPDSSFVQAAFDLNSRVTSLTDERGQTTTYEYDANGNLVRITDPLGAESSYVYDLMDQATQTTDRRGQTTVYTYDERNRLDSVADPNGNVSRFGYDLRGWQNQTTDAAGQVWQTGYDAEGLRTTYTTPLGHATTMSRNSIGQLAALTDALGHTTSFAYDERGRLTALTDPLGRANQFTYDARGLLVGASLPNGVAATYDYDDLGLLTTIHDPGGHEWTFTYTPMGRAQSLTDPLGHQWGYGYDQRGFLTQVTYPSGDTQSLTYDAAGNLTRQQYSAGPDLLFGYDDLNRLTAANGLALAYNAEGQTTSTTDTATGSVFGASYDDGGRLETVTYPSTGLRAGADGLFSVTYQYNTRDLLTRVSDDLTGVSVQFTYDDDGRPIGMQRSNGVDAALTWDAASRLTRIQEGTLIDLQYTYDAANQTTQMAMSLPLDPGDYIVTGTVAYTFDAASQISNPGYTYDAHGRLTADPQRAYTWDGASRLVGIGQDTLLSYNGLGDLLTRSAGGQTTRYFYNHALGLTPIVAERDEGSGQFQRFYVWTPGGALLYMIDATAGNQVRFYHFDRGGSTLALTDQTGNLTDAYAYGPYGRLLQHQGSSAQPFTFVGRWGVRQEGDSGALYQMRARYYDAATGRFISREPLWPTIANPTKLNPYQYALNNPCSLADVTGQEEACLTEELQRDWAGLLYASFGAIRQVEAERRYSNELLYASFGEIRQVAELKRYSNELLYASFGEIRQVEYEALYASFGEAALQQEIQRNFDEAAVYIGKALAIKRCLSELRAEERRASARREETMRRWRAAERRVLEFEKELKAGLGESVEKLSVIATESAGSDWLWHPPEGSVDVDVDF